MLTILQLCERMEYLYQKPNSQMKNKVQKQSTIIAKMLQQMHPCFYACHVRQDFIVLCQSPTGTQISKLVADFFHKSMTYYLSEILPKEKASKTSQQQYHKMRLANLLVSCRQQIQENEVQGSCSFGICFAYNHQLYCLRSQGIQFYVLDEQNSKIWQIKSQSQYPISKKSRNKIITQCYFSYNMTKIKPQYIYQHNESFKKQIYFEKIAKNIILQNQYIKILIGCSQTFELIAPESILKYFKDNAGRSDCQKTNKLLEQAKKKAKSVHNLDLSLVCWKICISDAEQHVSK